MISRAFKLPDIGEGTAEAELVCWHVQVGDLVEEDQPLCDVMTDKATVEVTAPFPGRVVERHGVPGELLPVGSAILMFDVADGDADEGPAVLVPEATTQAFEADVQSASGGADEAPQRVLASPALRKRAADQGLDLGKVFGSGPGGRIRQSDIDAYLAYARAAPDPTLSSPQAGSTPRSARAASSAGTGDDYEEVPVIGLRRRIAERMQDTKRRIPHFSYIEEIDVTELEALRAQLNANRHEGRPKLTLLPFLIRAIGASVPAHPQLNALYDDDAGVVRRYSAVHAGVATQTQKGLVVAVLRDVVKHDIWALAAEVARLSGLAREMRAGPSDLAGSTITITSLGAMGGIASTPVINSPEVAIIGVNKVVERPVVKEGRFAVAKMMNLSSSFDHRVVDGWDAASFIQHVKRLLETPALLFVDA